MNILKLSVPYLIGAGCTNVTSLLAHAPITPLRYGQPHFSRRPLRTAGCPVVDLGSVNIVGDGFAAYSILARIDKLTSNTTAMKFEGDVTAFRQLKKLAKRGFHAAAQ